MKVLVVYDSQFGNTEMAAKAIGEAVSGKTIHISKLKPDDLKSVDFLIVGSPTQGGRPTGAVRYFLDNLQKEALRDVNVTAFDTRVSVKEQGLALRLLMKTIGFAAGKMAKTLETKGGKLIKPEEGFIVSGKEGPLKKGELERATAWASGWF